MQLLSSESHMNIDFVSQKLEINQGSLLHYNSTLALSLLEVSSGLQSLRIFPATQIRVDRFRVSCRYIE